MDKITHRIKSDASHSVELLTNQKFLNTSQMAKLFGIKPNTAEIWRVRGIGPRFCKFGRAVRYRFSDLEAYIDGQTRTCTSQSGDSLSHA